MNGIKNTQLFNLKKSYLFRFLGVMSECKAAVILVAHFSYTVSEQFLAVLVIRFGFKAQIRYILQIVVQGI